MLVGRKMDQKRDFAGLLGIFAGGRATRAWEMRKIGGFQHRDILSPAG